MKTSKKGYLRNSPDVNKPQNIIKGGDITMKGVDFNVHGVDSNGYAKVMTPGNNYKFPNAEYVIETPIKNNKKMNKDLKYMPIDDKAGTFMSKHCSPVSYGTPLEKKSCSAANYGSPLNQFQEQASAKEAPSVAVRQKSTIINPNFAKLTKKQKDSLHKKAMDAGKVIYSEKFKVEVDPQDGVLQRMKNPNYKK